jgi:hypothetical protein
MTETPDARREEAARRVRARFARRRDELERAQRSRRRDDLRDQKQVLNDLDTREGALREQRRLALEKLDQSWEQEQQRLAARSAPAPAFGMALPSRDLRQEYDQGRASYEQRRDQIRDRYEEQQMDLQRERQLKLHEFQTANLARETAFEGAKIQQVERQQRTFERLVDQELARDRSPREEFTRNSKGPDR